MAYSIFDEKDNRSLKEKAAQNNSFLSTLGQKLNPTSSSKPTFSSTSSKPLGTDPYTHASIPSNTSEPDRLRMLQEQGAADTKRAKFENSFLGKTANFFGAAVPTLVKGIVETPQTVFHQGARFAKSAMINAKNQSEFVPTTGAEKIIYGEQPIKNFRGTGERNIEAFNNSDLVKKTGLNIKNTPMSALIIGSLSTGVDLASVGLGGEESVLKNSLLKEGTEQGITKILRERNFSPETTAQFSKQLAEATKPKEVSAILRDAAAHEAQVLNKKAVTRLGELDSKAKGEHLDPTTGEKIISEPQILTAQELSEQQFLKKNIDNPAKLSESFRTNVPEEKIKATPEDVSTRSIDELKSSRAADDISSVNKYVEELKANKTLEPLKVSRQADGSFKVEDGVHRLEAYKQLGQSDIPVVYTKSAKAAPTVFEKVAQKIDVTDKALITEYVDAVNTGKTPNPEVAKKVQEIAQVAELPNAFSGNKALANDLTSVLDAERQNVKNTIAENKIVSIPEGKVFKDKNSNTVDQIVNKEGDIVYDKNGTGDIKFGDTGPLTPKKAKQYNESRNKLQKAWLNIREQVQDRWVKVNKAIKEGGTVDVENNPYITETLYHGRLGTRVEAIKDEARTIVFDIQKESKATGLKPEVLTKEVNDYLIAKHAPERNAKLGEGAAGMTDAEAKAIVDKVENGSVFDNQTRYYRGGTSYDPKKVKTDGVSISKSEESAGRFVNKDSSGFPRKGDIQELYLSNDAKILDPSNLTPDKIKNDLTDDNIFQYARENGYDAVDLSKIENKTRDSLGYKREEELRVVNPDVLKTKEQLINSNKKSNSKGEKIQAIAQKITDLNKETLDILYADGKPWGLITKEQYDAMKSTYKNHVPLNRILDDTGDGDIGSVISGKGLDVRGSGLRRAKGSEKEVSDILGNVVANVAQATTRIEKNLINYDLYKYAVENPDNGWIGVKNRTPIGKDFEGNMIFKPETNADTLQMMVDGKTKYLQFKDPAMAETVRGVNLEHLPPIVSWVGAFSRLLSNLATRFNPAFWVTNKFRDVQDAMIFASSQGKLSARQQLGKQLKLEGEKAVLDHLRGADTTGAKLYKQMLEDGGTTGGMSLSTKKQVDLDLDKLRTLAASKPRQVIEAVMNKIDQTNEVIENSTRYVIYKQALENGASRREAAYLAKESTVNFNRKGKSGPVINALYMFSNASIQGTAKSLKSLRNPKTLAYTVGTLTAATYAVNKYNESIDPDWRDKVSSYERNGGITVLLPGENKQGEHNRIVIPIPYSIRFIKGSVDALYDAADPKYSGNSSFGQVMGSITASIADGYNPLGGTDLVSTITPTIADLPEEVIRNKKWSGSKIAPDYDPNLPASRKYFDSLKETDFGKILIATTKELSDKANIEISPEVANYVFQQLTGGVGQFGQKVFGSASKAIQGEPIPTSEIPFVSRFLKKGDAQALEKFGNKQDKGDLNAVKSEQSKLSFDRQQEAKDVIAEIKGKPKEEVAARLTEIAKTNKPLAEEIIKQVKDLGKGLTSEEKQIQSLDIKNGGRAKYISLKLARLDTPEEKKAYLLGLAEKKLITAEVVQQMQALKQQGQSE